MRKLKLFFACLLMAVLSIGQMWGAEGDTHDFSQSFSQLLNNDASISSINIAAQSYPIKEVIVSFRYNKTIENAVTMEVSVGGTSWGTQYSEGTDKSYTTRSFTHDAATGAIVISFTNNTGDGTGHGTFYVNNVQLVEGASGGTDPGDEPGGDEPGGDEPGGDSEEAGEGTILFGSGAGRTNVNSTSVNGNDSRGKSWTVTTVPGSSGQSFTANAAYAQIGASSKPASSITFEMTLSEEMSVTDFSANFGGFSGTAGTVTLKVGTTTVATGSLSGTSDVTVGGHLTNAQGTTLTVTVTGISKGVKAYSISYTVAAKGGTDPSAPTVTSIDILTPPTKDTYYSEETIDLTGIIVKATLSDNSEENPVDISKLSASAIAKAADKLNVEQPITVTYGGQSDTYNITLIPYTPAGAAALIPNTNDTKNSIYTEGVVTRKLESDWNPEYGNILYWISEDGTTTDELEVYRGKDLGNVKFENFDDLKEGDKVIVYGNLKNYSGTKEYLQNNYLISHTARELSSLAISGDLTETSYNLNATELNYAGLTVKATYQTGYEGDVTADVEWSIEPATLSTAGDEIAVTITASYTENNVNKTASKDVIVSVSDKVLTSITIPDNYSANIYCGQEIPKPTVTAHFDDLSTSDVTEASTLSEVDILTPGVYNVTVSYTYGDVTKTAEFELTINAYSVAEIQSVIPSTGEISTAVEGVIRWIDYVNEGSFAKYSISATGSKDDTDTLLIYNSYAGKDNNGYIKFEYADDIEVGDKVVVAGKFTTYNSIKETKTKESYISSLTKKSLTSLAISGSLTTTVYELNDDIDVDGLFVTGLYNTGYEQDVTANVTWTSDPEHLSTVGESVSVHLTATIVTISDEIDVIVTVTAPAPDNRYKAEQTGFDAISGKLTTVTEGAHQGKEYISYEAKKGDASTAPAIYDTDKIRLYQNGGLLVIGAAKGCKIDQVFLTTGSTYASTTIGYSKTETAIAQTGDVVTASTEWHTATGQNADTIVIVCLGTNNTSRIDVAKLDVRYTGDPAAIHHYVLAGNYATVFNQADVFNHDGLIVYAAYDEQGEDVVDITDECSFSAPVMNQAGEQTIEITYNNAVVQSYTITINATETAKLKFYAPVAWENVYAFTWEGTNPGGHEMTAVEEGSRWFECELEKGVPFLVYNGSWDGMNQTENIAALDGPKCYAWATLSGNGKYNTIETCEMSYYIAGENLPEVTWNEGEHKAMTNNEVVFENLAAGTYKFKVTSNTWAWNLGYAYADQTNSNITLVDDNGNVQFTTNVAMNVTIAYNPATEKITVNGIVPPKPFDPNIKFGNAGTKINGTNVNGTDSYNNTWNVVTVPGAAGQSFSQNAEYSQVGSSNKPAESITFSATLANSNEIAAISYIAIKLGGFANTAGDVVINVDGTEYANGALDGTNDVVVATSANPMMGREISIEISNIARGVKCYGIEYAYQKYEFVALKFFAPRDENNKWDHVYAYAYDPNNNYQAYIAWPGEEVTAKDAEWYVYNAPKGHNVIFHDNAGMQTNDIVDVQEAACYVPTSIDYTATPHLVTLAEQCTVDYYVSGNADFMAEWAPANALCKFDENNQVVFHDVPAGEYQFKITNGSWAWSLGGNEFLKNEEGCGSIAYTGGLGNTCFKIDEVQDITITFYPATREICLGAVTVKTPGELTANDIELYIDEWKTPNYWTNITDYTAADVELTFVSGDDCIEIANGQMRGKAEGSAVVKIAIAETALFTGVENTFTVTVSAVPPTPDYGSYQRDVTNGNYGTICLPKAGTITGATLFEIADFENNMIYVDEVEGGVMEAGKPYIFQATSDQLNVAYTSNVEVAAGENNGLHGFYNLENENATLPLAGDASLGNYILYQNQYWLVSGRAAYIANYRAYIKISEINSVAPAPGRRRVAMNVNGEQTATGINELNAAEVPVKMIMNGQLYILRGEKLYNANGQIVK